MGFTEQMDGSQLHLHLLIPVLLLMISEDFLKAVMDMKAGRVSVEVADPPLIAGGLMSG